MTRDMTWYHFSSQKSQRRADERNKKFKLDGIFRYFAQLNVLRSDKFIFVGVSVDESKQNTGKYRNKKNIVKKLQSCYKVELDR